VRAIPEGANKASNDGRLALIDAYLCGIGDECLPCVTTELVQSKEKSEMARLNDAISQLESIAKSSGLHFVRQSEYDAANRMRDAVFKHSEAAFLLAGGRTEHTLLYQYGGVDCKARPDLLPRNSPVVVDVKKTLDASKHAFRASIRRYGYDIQAAWYLNAAERSNIRADEFIWLAVESDPPYGIALYSAGIGILSEGSARYESAIATYRDCLTSGEWPSYPKQIETIELYADAELGADELTEVDE
jgi:hypothetical protein